MKPRVRVGRKLLVASLGVAAVSYVQCGGDTDSGSSKKDAGSDSSKYDAVANLVAPDTGNGFDAVANLVAPDVNVFDVVANLVAPDVNVFDVVANLVAPDAGSD